MTTNKDVLELMRKDYELRNAVREQGVDPDQVKPWPQVTEMLDPSMRPQIKKERSHPYDAGEAPLEKIKLNLNN
jgi:hypothetical protein